MRRWPPPIQRFWSYVDQSAGADGCWIWTGPKDSHGYGQLYWNGRYRLATGVAMELAGRPIPRGVCALHRCDTPACVNPSHLFEGTRADNIADMIAKGRDRKATGDAHGSRTHPSSSSRGERHGGAKLKDVDVLYIRSSSESGAAIARRIGVHRSLVNMVRRNKAWRHI